MICPRCGAEMVMDEHRKIPLHMCYECGYIEGRSIDNDNFSQEKETNFKHMKGLNLNELLAFLSQGLGIDEEKLFEFMDAEYKS